MLALYIITQEYLKRLRPLEKTFMNDLVEFQFLKFPPFVTMFVTQLVKRHIFNNSAESDWLKRTDSEGFKVVIYNTITVQTYFVNIVII